MQQTTKLLQQLCRHYLSVYCVKLNISSTYLGSKKNQVTTHESENTFYLDRLAPLIDERDKCGRFHIFKFA